MIKILFVTVDIAVSYLNNFFKEIFYISLKKYRSCEELKFFLNISLKIPERFYEKKMELMKKL